MTDTSDPIARGLLPEGFRDRLAPQAAHAEAVVARLSAAIAAHGYDRIQPPLVEFEDGLTGRLSSVGAQDLLRLIDPLSQRTLALRSDITPQAGRIAATRLAGRPRPLRLSYAGSVLRVRPPQVGAEREAVQVGAELVGHDTLAAASEILTVALEALIAAGATDLSVDITLPSLVGELAGSAWPVEDLDAVRAALDGKDQAALAAVGGATYAPLIDAAGPAADAVAALRAAALGDRFDARIDAAAELARRAGTHARVTLDPTERRGFEFQTWLGFSLFAGAARGEIGRGGTYTIRHPDGRAEPAVGMSLFVDPLIADLPAAAAPDRIFLPPGTSPETGARLRSKTWVTVAAMTDADDPAALGCTHIWRDGPVKL
ncbi:MAG: ATP phosphoribosyltransferase regulatory subunit [Pseudomonadota bacterium]